MEWQDERASLTADILYPATTACHGGAGGGWP